MSIAVKPIARVLMIPILLLLVGCLACLYLFVTWNSPPEYMPEEAQFEIFKGDTLNEIAERLEELQVIRSRFALIAYSTLRRSSSSIQAGVYSIPGGSPMTEVHNLIHTGSQLQETVTIPEGSTSRMIAHLMEDAGITDASEFLKAAETGTLLLEYGIEADSLEGFLYPDTYLFPRNYPATRVVAGLVENFFYNFGKIKQGFPPMTGDKIYGKVILASIVEREYRVSSEASRIASVFYNRLEEGIRLESCATIAYIITELQQKPHPRRLFFQDLEIESEYNTYINFGLPPTPISNPGWVALEAAFIPADTDHLFFVLESPESGTHKFSRTYSEHLTAKNLYIKGGG